MRHVHTLPVLLSKAGPRLPCPQQVPRSIHPSIHPSINRERLRPHQKNIVYTLTAHPGRHRRWHLYTVRCCCWPQRSTQCHPPFSTAALGLYISMRPAICHQKHDDDDDDDGYTEKKKIRPKTKKGQEQHVKNTWSKTKCRNTHSGPQASCGVSVLFVTPAAPR